MNKNNITALETMAAYHTMLLKEAKISKMLVVHIEDRIEPQVDVMVDNAGDLIKAEYGLDSKEFKTYDKKTKELYSILVELKQLFNKL